MNIRSIPPHLGSRHALALPRTDQFLNGFNLATGPPVFNREMRAFGLRRYYTGFGTRYRLRAHPWDFSILHQNMALMVFPESYKGVHDRDEAVRAIIHYIRMERPDVVGLCEVFSDGERERIWGALKDDYPWAPYGPDRDDMLSDGGLLLMSRHEVLDTEQVVFRAKRGRDAWANKGVIHIRIHPPGIPAPINLFYSHTQDLAASAHPSNVLAGAWEATPHEEVLKRQLADIATLMEEKSGPLGTAIVFGDLNFHGGDAQLWGEMLAALGAPADLWIAGGNHPEKGPTNRRSNSFHASDESRPAGDERLDYFLMKTNPLFIPMLGSVEQKHFILNGRDLSDHDGLHLRFRRYLHTTIF